MNQEISQIIKAQRFIALQKTLFQKICTLDEEIVVLLPKQKFDGHPEHWIEFWDTFNHAIHENDCISETQKMTYLKNLVTQLHKRLQAFKYVKKIIIWL